jgi:hypothetical protein
MAVPSVGRVGAERSNGSSRGFTTPVVESHRPGIIFRLYRMTRRDVKPARSRLSDGDTSTPFETTPVALQATGR